jgi:hypothetical protein
MEVSKKEYKVYQIERTQEQLSNKSEIKLIVAPPTTNKLENTYSKGINVGDIAKGLDSIFPQKFETEESARKFISELTEHNPDKQYAILIEV